MSGNCADSSSLPGLIKDISWKKIAGAIPAPLPPPKILHPFSLLRLKAGKWGSLGSGNGDAAQMKFGEAQEGSSTLWSKMSISEGAILPSGRVLWQHRRCKCSGAAAAQTCHRVAPSLETKQLFFVVLAHLAPICSFTSPWSCSSDGCPANPGQLPVLWCHLQGCTVAEKLLLPTSNNE